MAAKHVLNQDLFHGTGGAIEGGVVHPDPEQWSTFGAYGSTSIYTAQHFAQQKARSQGRLFGTVYRVKPLSKNPTVLNQGAEDYVVDSKGLQVQEAVDYPINDYALHKTSRWGQ